MVEWESLCIFRDQNFGNQGQIRLTRKQSHTFIALILNPSLIGSKNSVRKASMLQKKKMSFSLTFLNSNQTCQ